jgi:hypothetical protein
MTTATLPPVVRKMRRVMELVGALHHLGYQRLRLTCHVVLGIAPTPIWLGNIVPVTCTRRSHGALLIDGAISPGGARFLPADSPHDLPTFSERRMINTAGWPWRRFVKQTPQECALSWLRLFPDLAEEGRGADKPYADWYATVLAATAPGGVLVAAESWLPVPTRIHVRCGPSPVETVPLPPPGEGD